jgi:hypothetical protein
MEFLDWLFNTRGGVAALFGVGILICLVIAFVLERKTKKMYFNHEKQEGEEDSIFESLFGGDDEDADKDDE